MSKTYEENKELTNKLLLDMIKKYTDKKLSIESGSIINNEIIKEISQNKIIEEVNLGSFKDEYILKEEDYLILKNSIKKIITDGVEDKLKYNFDEIIDFNRKKPLISHLNYEDLQKDKLRIGGTIKEKDLVYLKYIGDNTTLDITENVNIFDIVKKLESCNKKNNIIYDLPSNKEEFNKKLIQENIDYQNLYIRIRHDTYSLKEYLEYEKMLYSFVEPAQKLSPFEKYIYAYDIVKKFKKYKKNKKDKMKSRRLYDILDNNYMVCVGYSRMLGDLLNKLEIENIEHSIDVGLKPYKALAQLKNKYKDEWNKLSNIEKQNLINSQKNYIPETTSGHSRRLIHLVDEKYNINGLYFSDPTWDNNLKENSYNHLLMTSEEVLTSSNKFKFENDSSELLYIRNVEEFNNKLNIILNRRNKSTNEKNNNKLEEEMCKIVNNLTQTIKNIDKNFYKKMQEKYEFLDKSNFKIDNIYNISNEITDYLYDVANYITNNINNPVNGKTILEAVKNVYNNVYVGGIDKQYLSEIQEYNSKIAENEFQSNKFKI